VITYLASGNEKRQKLMQQLIPTTEITIKTKATAPGIVVGLSACLAGHAVRYNGGHSQSRLCLNTLSDHFQFETFCPEVAAGFGTPRPVMRLIGDPQNPVLTYSDNQQQNLTEKLVSAFNKPLETMGRLDGYILMKNSPSCGLERIKIYQANGSLHVQRGRGLFAAALKQKYPLMPIEEEGRLHDRRLHENFILRVYAHHRFRCEVAADPTVHKLIAFHSSYKYVLMAHDQGYYRSLGAMLAAPKSVPLEQLLEDYFQMFMTALAKPATAKNHCNVLQHLLGYLKQDVSSSARQSIDEVIHRYRQGEVPLVVPLTLIRHYIEQEGNEYIRMQCYLQPYPDKLGLANRI